MEEISKQKGGSERKNLERRSSGGSRFWDINILSTTKVSLILSVLQAQKFYGTRKKWGCVVPVIKIRFPDLQNSAMEQTDLL